jgi:hypothetical protein
MKHSIHLLFFCLLFSSQLWSQSKVFKEIANEIDSRFLPIEQDNKLVGYTMFSKIEKASKDSFNYKIVILDENLNDLGVVDLKTMCFAMLI